MTDAAGLESVGVVGEELRQETKNRLGEHAWRLGRVPESTEEWALEILLVDDNYRQRFNNLQRDLERAPSWLYGRPPANQEEANEELQLRDLEKRWQVELDDRKNRAELEFTAARQTSKGESIRSYVLLAVVLAVVATPVYAMTVNIDPQSFGQYIAPITGIAGTIIGYWFGQRSGQTTIVSPPSTQGEQAPRQPTSAA
jgi:hypothetical protein